MEFENMHTCPTKYIRNKKTNWRIFFFVIFPVFSVLSREVLVFPGFLDISFDNSIYFLWIVKSYLRSSLSSYLHCCLSQWSVRANIFVSRDHSPLMIRGPQDIQERWRSISALHTVAILQWSIPMDISPEYSGPARWDGYDSITKREVWSGHASSVQIRYFVIRP